MIRIILLAIVSLGALALGGWLFKGAIFLCQERHNQEKQKKASFPIGSLLFFFLTGAFCVFAALFLPYRLYVTPKKMDNEARKALEQKCREYITQFDYGNEYGESVPVFFVEPISYEINELNRSGQINDSYLHYDAIITWHVNAICPTQDEDYWTYTIAKRFGEEDISTDLFFSDLLFKEQKIPIKASRHDMKIVVLDGQPTKTNVGHEKIKTGFVNSYVDSFGHSRIEAYSVISTILKREYPSAKAIGAIDDVNIYCVGATWVVSGQFKFPNGDEVYDREFAAAFTYTSKAGDYRDSSVYGFDYKYESAPSSREVVGSINKSSTVTVIIDGEEVEINENDLIDLKDLDPWEAEGMFGRDSDTYWEWVEAVENRRDFDELIVEWLVCSNPLCLNSSAICEVYVVYPFNYLAITFQNHPKDLYVYYDIPGNLYFDQLSIANSPGKYFNEHIKGKYEYNVYKNYFK